MRRTPYWQAAKRKRAPTGRRIPQGMLARRTSFGDFSEGSGRVQCGAIAKMTGKRCRKDAIGGTARCKSHKGIAAAMAKARAKGERPIRANASAARMMLFAAGMDAPEGFKSEALGVEKGREIEALKNAQTFRIVSKNDDRE